MDEFKAHKKEVNKRIFMGYIKERIGAVFLYALMIGVFQLISLLYGYADISKNMSYAAFITIFLGLCFFAAQYILYRKRCLSLYEALHKRIEGSILLPDPANLQEQLYQEILNAADKDNKELIFHLDKSEKDMSDYYTLWIHQIKTPISALKLLLQRDSKLKSEQEELFKIEQYAEMALCYARLNSLTSDLLLKKYNVYEIVKQAVKKYSILFIGSGLSFELKEFYLETITDEKWLSFVIEQLLSNALKYTIKGRITISKEEEEIVIQDTGIGIPEGDLPRVFERGFTGYNGRMDKKSTGLGLYLCKQIMDRLNHQITVESVISKGTVIRLLLHREELELKD